MRHRFTFAELPFGYSTMSENVEYKMKINAIVSDKFVRHLTHAISHT